VVLPCLQVDAAANRIAHYLRNKAGATPGDIIGVLVLRSPLMVATLLAVFKCSCGYLPLDHHHPEARIAFMLEDAAVKVGTCCVLRMCITDTPVAPADRCSHLVYAVCSACCMPAT
jgi:non-ribosomal peptide synthetase component F